MAGAVSPTGEPLADKFSFPVGALVNNPTTSRYTGPNGRQYMGWAVHPAATFLSPAYGNQLQAGEDWGGRGGGDTDLGQPVYAAAAGTILAAGYYGPQWNYVVLIKHTLPGDVVVLTQYAYLQDITKNSGTVDYREVIGHIGKGAGGSVLHFEVRKESMLEFPADYWPSNDGKDDEWVRRHYYSPTLFIRTHFRILAPLPRPSEPGEPGSNPNPGTNPGNGNPSENPGNGNPPGNPGGGPGPVNPGPVTVPPPSSQAWDGVPHLEGSILKSATGSLYLLQSGKKWPILSPQVLATWARPEEALPATDEELASYPTASHALGLRWGVLFKGATGPTCIAGDPFGDPGLSCWVIDSDETFAARGFSRTAVRSQSAQTLDLYIRPTPFDRNTALPQGMLIKKPYGGYYVTDMMFGYLPAVRPVTSTSALRSWQIDPGTAVEVYSDQFWDRIGRLEPLRFRPGSILQSPSGQIWVVSGEYRHLVPSMEMFEHRGYSKANVIAVSDDELALHKAWPTPLK
jgi:murein DD-endopeptidase MepM/ murein hydrolase activator NlpD